MLYSSLMRTRCLVVLFDAIIDCSRSGIVAQLLISRRGVMMASSRVVLAVVKEAHVLLSAALIILVGELVALPGLMGVRSKMRCSRSGLLRILGLDVR